MENDQKMVSFLPSIQKRRKGKNKYPSRFSKSLHTVKNRNYKVCHRVILYLKFSNRKYDVASFKQHIPQILLYVGKCSK